MSSSTNKLVSAERGKRPRGGERTNAIRGGSVLDHTLSWAGRQQLESFLLESFCPICSASELSVLLRKLSVQIAPEPGVRLLAVSVVSSLAEPTPLTPSSTMSFRTDGKRWVAGPNSCTHVAF